MARRKRGNAGNATGNLSWEKIKVARPCSRKLVACHTGSKEIALENINPSFFKKKGLFLLAFFFCGNTEYRMWGGACNLAALQYPCPRPPTLQRNSLGQHRQARGRETLQKKICPSLRQTSWTVSLVRKKTVGYPKPLSYWRLGAGGCSLCSIDRCK